MKHLPNALPPNMNIRVPKWALPEDACDTHFHIFGPPGKFPFADTRRYNPATAPIENYLKMQSVVGLTRGIAVQPTVHGFNNEAILDAVKHSGGKIRGIIRFTENTRDSELELMHEYGIRGARFSLMSDRSGNIEHLKVALPRLEK